MQTNPVVRAALLVSVAAMSIAAEGGGGGSAPKAPSLSAPDYDPAAEYQLGMEALKAERYADAKKSFLKVYPDASRDASMNVVLGITLMRLDDFKGARKYLEKAVKYDKKLVIAHEQLGITYAKLGERAKAEAEVETLKQLQSACGTSCPDADLLSRAISALTEALGQPQAAIAVPGELLFASTESGDTFYLDAVSLIHERRYVEALELFGQGQGRVRGTS